MILECPWASRLEIQTWSSAERPEKKVTVEVATLEGSQEGGSPETAETSVAAFEELRPRGRKRTALAEEKGG